jgi:hypothetical protein
MSKEGTGCGYESGRQPLSDPVGGDRRDRDPLRLKMGRRYWVLFAVVVIVLVVVWWMWHQ